MNPSIDHDGITTRLLAPSESALIVAAIQETYGSTYDVAWCYDADELAARIAHGQMISCGAFDEAGSLLAHAALTRGHHDGHVVHAGQAVTLPAARARHLSTRVKRHLADWATTRGILGIYSEDSAVHAQTQETNVELGAHETGFLLGWIPAGVGDDPARRPESRRESTVLFYLATNDPHQPPLYVPPRHRALVGRLVDSCRLRGRPAEAGDTVAIAEHTRTNTVVDHDHDLAVIGIRSAGRDLADAVATTRDRLFARGLDVVYADLPLGSPATERFGDDLADAGFGFAGVFPSAHQEGEVLRLQSLNGIALRADDVSVASDHGRWLLDYVLADLPVTTGRAALLV